MAIDQNDLPKVSLPAPVFGGVHFSKQGFTVTILDKKGRVDTCESFPSTSNTSAGFISWLHYYASDKNKKIISMGISGGKWKTLYRKLWLKLDIVPIQVSPDESTPKEMSKAAAIVGKAGFGEDNSHAAKVNGYGRVYSPPLVALSDYEAITHPLEFRFLLDQAREFKGRKLAFISATPQGGGVAIMRHGNMRLLKLLGVNADWIILKDDEEAFNITKRKFHNIFQNVAPDGESLSQDEMDYFDKWSAKNAEELKDIFPDYDVIIIDDPQPAGLFPYIKRVNPTAKIIFRSHIELIAKLATKIGSTQKISWDFVWNKVKSCDVFVSHPVRSFVPKNVPNSKVVFAPPCTDPLDGLNKELTDEQKSYYMRLLNDFLVSFKQTPLDPNRPYITQIARFDPSKGIPDLLEAYRLLVKKYQNTNLPIPQLVIAGNGSIDDPDGIPILDFINKVINTPRFRKIKNDIKVLRLPHNDQLMNTIARQSKIMLQLSHHEGFEFKIAEGLMKGKPVIIYGVGGMPTQVTDGVNGFVIKIGDTKAVADKLFELMTNDKLYSILSENAKNISPDVFTVSHTASWLWLANEVIKNPQFSPNGKYIKDLSGQADFPVPRLTIID